MSTKLQEMRRKLAEQDTTASKPQDVTASQPSKVEASQPYRATASQGDEVALPVPALDPIEQEAVAEVEAVKPSETVEAPAISEPASTGRKVKAKPPAKVEKRSTSLYLTPDALKALNVLAANQGVRPHRLIDDGLRYVFKKHGLDFDALNATDS